MITLQNVHKIYTIGNAEVRALAGVSLDIREGEFIAIMGPSGSGKSTLLHILGLLDVPDRGTYELDGRVVSSLPDNDLAALRNRTIGYVFQMFNLLSRTPALDNVILPLVYSKQIVDADSKKPEELLEEVGLGSRIHHKPNELSGGEQQRVAIARALINRPKLILADEPTGNLDSKTQNEIMAILADLNRKGITIVLVTHEEEVAEYAARIIKMKDGVIVSDTRRPDSMPPAPPPRRDESASSALSQKNGWRSFFTLPALREFTIFVKQAVVAILANKVRSGLSVIGILIGVASVISMLALGEGTRASVTADLERLGSNLLVVRPGPANMRGVMLEAGAVTRLTLGDAEDIAKIQGVRSISPEINGNGQVVYENKNWNTFLQGVSSDYAKMRNSEPIEGRFFSEEENRAQAKVAVLGSTVTRELFGKEDPVGKSIRLNRITFRVIGILPEKGGGHFRDEDNVVLVPILTAMKRLLGTEYVSSINVEASSKELIDSVTEEIKKTIIRRHRLIPSREDSFQIRNMTEIQESVSKVTQTLMIFLASITGIALFVGGIGIMNMMLVSVTERTREIGLRKAVGAKHSDIYMQFLIEAVVISLLGGGAGILVGSGVAYVASEFFNWSAKISVNSILLAVGFSTVVGVLFGLWPAQKAAKLDPITALRYE